MVEQKSIPYEIVPEPKFNAVRQIITGANENDVSPVPSDSLMALGPVPFSMDHLRN